MKDQDHPLDKGETGKPELFYFENGLIVFTREYHLQRGYCCESGCRHCPYGFSRKDKTGGAGISQGET